MTFTDFGEASIPAYRAAMQAAIQAQQNVLTSMSELAGQAANGTYTSEQRTALQKEFQALKEELIHIDQTTEYNGRKLLQGDRADGISATWVQAGIAAGTQGGYFIEHPDILMPSAATGVTTLDLGSVPSAASAATKMTTMVNTYPGAASFTLAQWKSFFSTDQTISVTGTNGGLPRQITWLAIGVKSFSDGQSQVAFLGLEASTVTPGNWDTYLSAVDALSVINLSNRTSAAPGVSRTMVVDSTGTVTSEGLSGLTLDNGTVAPTLSASNYTFDKLVIDTEDAAQATVDALTSLQTDRSEALAQVESSLSRMNISFDTMSQMREQRVTAADRITDSDTAADVAEYLSQKILQESVTAVMAAANQQIHMVLSLVTDLPSLSSGG